MSRPFVVACVVATLAASCPVHAKGAAKDSCFSESAGPNQRIAACTALVRSGAARNSAVVRAEAFALLNRADAFGQKGDYVRAIEDVTRVIKQAPSPTAYYTRALAFHNLGEERRAIADCNAALDIEPGNVNALFVRAASYQGLGDYDRAIRDYTEVLRHNPGRVDALFSRGAAHYSVRDFDRAVEDSTRTIDLGAAAGTVFYLRGLAYKELGRAADARADMAEAFRRDPNLRGRPPVQGLYPPLGRSSKPATSTATNVKAFTFGVGLLPRTAVKDCE